MNAVQPGLFDIQEGRKRRDAGRDRAASAHAKWLWKARDEAVIACHVYGKVTSDDLRERGIDTPEGASHNVWGQVFKDDRFIWTGDVVESKRPVAHARMLKVWRLK